MRFEAHITIEPVFGSRLSEFQALAARQGFRVAELLMQKSREETPVRSTKDAFCTGRDENFDRLRARVLDLIWELQAAGFSVWRYKLEETLLDVRLDRQTHQSLG